MVFSEMSHCQWTWGHILLPQWIRLELIPKYAPSSMLMPLFLRPHQCQMAIFSSSPVYMARIFHQHAQSLQCLGHLSLSAYAVHLCGQFPGAQIAYATSPWVQQPPVTLLWGQCTPHFTLMSHLLHIGHSPLSPWIVGHHSSFWN